MNTGANFHHVSFGDSTFINAYHLGCFFSVSKIVLRMFNILRASSYEPGQPGWLGFRDLASPLFSL